MRHTILFLNSYRKKKTPRCRLFHHYMQQRCTNCLQGLLRNQPRWWEAAPSSAAPVVVAEVREEEYCGVGNKTGLAEGAPCPKEADRADAVWSVSHSKPPLHAWTHHGGAGETRKSCINLNWTIIPYLAARITVPWHTCFWPQKKEKQYCYHGYISSSIAATLRTEQDYFCRKVLKFLKWLHCIKISYPAQFSQKRSCCRKSEIFLYHWRLKKSQNLI